jgi:Rrf2 family protein
MGISRKTDYALRVMVELTAKNGGPVSTKELADLADAPYAFVAKIVAELAARGFVDIARGRNGGVRLAIDPESTTALTVLEAISGPLQVSQCVNDPTACPRSGFCPLCEAFADAQRRLREALAVELSVLARTQKETLAVIRG